MRFSTSPQLDGHDEAKRALPGCVDRLKSGEDQVEITGKECVVKELVPARCGLVLEAMFEWGLVH